MKNPLSVKQLILTILCFVAATTAGAAIRLPDLVGPRMVLQQQSDALIWGWATPGAKIKVTPQWLGKTLPSVADTTGRWELRIPTPEASSTPYIILFEGDGSRLTLHDVLIGEVWFASGQSNMEMPLRGFYSQPVENAADAITSASRYPLVRIARVKKGASETPQDSVASPWLASTPQNAVEFSAVCYFFARELNDMLDVPVGIIDCSYDGTKIETWMSAERLASYPDVDLAKEKEEARSDFWHRANLMYNAMLYPVHGYTVRGFLWYQGCSNMGQAEYPERQRDFVEDLRTMWGDSSLPFIFVELAPYGYRDPEGDKAARFREGQHRAAQMIPNSAIVCTSDLIYPHEVKDIHPSRKQEVARRMAWLAGDMAYGIKGLPTEYPRFKSMELTPEGALLSFFGAPWGLIPHDDMRGFEVAGSDGVFHPAKAHVPFYTAQVLVECPESVDTITAVRYNFKNFAIGTIHDLMGLPLVPFRTDTD